MMILVKLLNKKRHFLFIPFFLFYSCNNVSNKTIINGNTMGTSYSITIENFNDNELILKSRIDSILNQINNYFSTYDQNSEISTINNSEADLINISKTFKYVLNKALYYCQLSNGLYDITIKPLVDIWGFNNEAKISFPNTDDIEDIIPLVNCGNLGLHNNYLIKKNKGIKIDLNSIAKGYAVDEVYNYLEMLNYDNFLIEIGGELRSYQSNIETDWIVGIQNPERNQFIKKIKLNNMSMATSGTYNNNFTHNNIKYSHIINPKTGYPIEYRRVSATIISNKCIDADAYATISMLLPINNLLELVNNNNSVECYILELNSEGILEEYMSNSFKNYIIY